MFNFRIINLPDGNQVIDRTVKTPYEALTPVQMVEYTEMDNRMAFMDRMERKTTNKKGKYSFATILANVINAL